MLLAIQECMVMRGRLIQPYFLPTKASCSQQLYTIVMEFGAIAAQITHDMRNGKCFDYWQDIRMVLDNSIKHQSNQNLSKKYQVSGVRCIEITNKMYKISKLLSSIF